MKKTFDNQKEMVDGIKSGNLDAYKLLFTKYYAAVNKFIFGILGRKDLAEDITQNVFCKIWIMREKLNGEGSITSLLYTMARNEAFNLLKARKRAILSFISEVTDLDVNDESSANDMAEFIDNSMRLRQNIDRMPEKRRQVFVMSRYEEMSNKEIAARLGISVRTVEKHIELAIRQLRQEIN